MASFAPVYRPPEFQQSFLTRRQKQHRKRKRNAADEQDDQSEEDSENEQNSTDQYGDAPRILHPVNSKDPYYVAGWPREKPLPGGTFPHAAIPDTKAEGTRTVEEDLANLNHPLYAPKSTPDDTSGSLRRRHLDNLTAILHKCMLNSDWTRASRVWGLILRTEVGGYGPDIRQHGRWMVGAELLMRRNQTIVDPAAQQSPSHDTARISDEGFRAAREYYERLVLQYPHQQRTHHSTVSAKVIYPALFNIWVYEVQDRSERARKSVHESKGASEVDETLSVASGSSERFAVQSIYSRELAEAQPIAHRLDDLLLNPPYDAQPELLELRGMIGLWLSDLHRLVSGRDLEGQDLTTTDEDTIRVYSATDKEHVEAAVAERAKARKLFQKILDANMSLQSQNLAFLQDGDDDG